MSVDVDHWDNDKYGFPDGKKRRVDPVALACIHITGNRNTASNPDLNAAARDEWSFARGAAPPSAHYYVARNGRAIEAIDPEKFAAWSNGDVMEPNRANRGVEKVLELAETHNANEAYWLEFECVGFGSRHRITKEQRQTVAEIIAKHAKRTGMPINRNTVHGHADINSVTRRSCPAAAGRREAFLADVIGRAKAVLNPPIPNPNPEPHQGEPMVIVTDDTAVEIDVRVGAIITDLNDVRIADVENQAFRPSPFGVAGGRAVIAVVGDEAVLGLVKDDDILEERVASTATEDDLEAAKAEGHAEGFQAARQRAAEVAVSAIQAI
jgi:N-acetylmuramoyl-L-alanine amidase-like protein